jgi:hypothetical protein
MGGKMIAIQDEDVSLVYQNPAMLNSSMHNHLALNYVMYFAEAYYSYASYALKTKTAGNFAIGVHYMNYGTFIEADETGDKTGTFYANQLALNFFWSYRIPVDTSLTVGVNFKPLMTTYEKYSSYGYAFDLGLAYQNPAKLFSAGLVIKNLGRQVLNSYNNDLEELPVEIALGISHKLPHAPLRFSVVAQQIQEPDLTYEIPGQVEEITLFGDVESQKESPFFTYSDYILRHLIFGAEMIITQNLYFRTGYNYLRRQELLYDTDYFSTVGFSWGFGIKIRKFHLSYARAAYHLAGSPNHFSLTTNLTEINNWIFH